MDYLEYAKAAGEIAATLTKQYGPAAWDTVLWITSINCLSEIASAIAALAVMSVLTYVVYRIGKYFSEDSDGVSYAFLLLPAMLWLFTSPIWGKIASVWLWVGVFKPDLYLAKLLMDKVL